jgi:hypothetical protein
MAVLIEAENRALRETPDGLLAAVEESLRTRDVEKAEMALKVLTDRHPESTQVASGSKLLEAARAKRRADEAEAKRMRELGFRALKANPVFAYGDTTITLSSVSISRTWSFDSYGSEYRYMEAEKGQKYITARVTVSSRSKGPELFGIAAYTLDGNRLVRLGTFDYRFVRWDDYGSYLGNTADYRNDFAHSSTIPFSLGLSADEANLKQTILLVVTREGCNTRMQDRFGRPPVSYFGGQCSSLKDTLSVDDFKGGALAVLRQIN